MTMKEKEEQPVVFVIDDDAAAREGVEDLLRSVGLEVLSFRTTLDFIQSTRPNAPGCLVLDVRLPGMSGLEFQRELSKSDVHLPIIFLTAFGDVAMSVDAIKSGAIGFLMKPFREHDLLVAVQDGIERDRVRRQGIAAVAELQKRYDELTSREREVLRLVLDGRANKQIAFDLEVSEMTVKVHRSHVMQKMRAKSVVELIRMADRLGVLADTSTIQRAYSAKPKK